MYRIVVIDDDPTIRKMLQMTLAPEGYECLTASTSQAGLKMCAAEKPDMVLLDVHLPDDNGIDVCRKIKADPMLAHIPVLLLTGAASDVESRTAGLDAGADDYILKPFNHKELMARLKRVLKTGVKPAH